MQLAALKEVDSQRKLPDLAPHDASLRGSDDSGRRSLSPSSATLGAGPASDPECAEKDSHHFHFRHHTLGHETLDYHQYLYQCHLNLITFTVS
ncbi:hypothetical protein PsorP6_017456 [Peronosclerospora sorghi]|uniref:Uncharacterized protein n=1 Tax=Peronosclerospora sorghi TaxID=230839 RepID=A0ACC0WMF3_9STRA|nr:hypothetical protein PsorP6_017456 [Peronosclerospora sorghi]